MPRILLLLVLALLLAAPVGAAPSGADPSLQSCAKAVSLAADDDSSPASDEEAAALCHDKHPTVAEWRPPHLREEDAALGGTGPRALSRVFIALILPPPR